MRWIPWLKTKIKRHFRLPQRPQCPQQQPSQHLRLLAVVVIGGSLLCWLDWLKVQVPMARPLVRLSSHQYHQLLSSNNGIAMTTTTSLSPPVFSLFVTLQFTAEQHKATFLNDITPLADYVRNQEPDTLSYKVLLSDKDPLRVLIIERYADQANAFVAVHRNSPPFLEFRPKLQALQEAGHVTIHGESYIDSTVGFGDRAVVDR
jgi:quinol monooxygenase YgiN